MEQVSCHLGFSHLFLISKYKLLFLVLQEIHTQSEANFADLHSLLSALHSLEPEEIGHLFQAGKSTWILLAQAEEVKNSCNKEILY